MIKTIYRTSDGKEYLNKEEAIKHEIGTLYEDYVVALAKYQYLRFSEHRCNVKNYLRYKYMTVDEFLKLDGNKTLTRTSARKKLWECRKYYKGRVKEGERRIRERKAVLRTQMENIKQEVAQMKS